MKKTYQKPSTVVVAVRMGQIIAFSEGVWSNSLGDGIGYGGVDKDGSLDPSVKHRNLWDDEW